MKSDARAGGHQLAPERLDRPFADPLVGQLFPPLATGVHWGLERTVHALEMLGDPHRSYPTIHVGGTNGKGSVTTTIASVLSTSGLRAASYTSPHLCSFRERVLIDGLPLDEETLLGYAEEVRDAVVRSELTFFEAVTVLSFHAMAREGVEAAVVEVGLGGRLDATNVLQPEVTAITNIALDHADYLGDTLPEIALEKAGIMKAGVPVVTAEQDPEIVGVLRAVAESVGAPFHPVAQGTLRGVVVARAATRLAVSSPVFGALRLQTPLVGHHQAVNAALAVAALERLPAPLRPFASAVVEGVRRVEYHGRDEIAEVGDRTWLFDVAHNTAGIRSLVDTVDRLDLPKPLVAVVGVLGDKDWREMLQALLARVDSAVLTQPPSAPPERRWNPTQAAAEVQPITDTEVVEDFERALEVAGERAGPGTIVVTGSVHTVGSAMKVLGLEPLPAAG